MNIPELVERYFDKIEVEDTFFVPIDNAVSDAACLLLNIPTQMVRDYQKLKRSRKRLPDGAVFWKESGLVTKLRNCARFQDVGYEQLDNILDYLGGAVWGTYQILNDKTRIRLDVTEIPEFHSD